MDALIKMHSKMPNFHKAKKILEKSLIKNGQDLETFFDNSLKNLPNMSDLLDIDKASERILRAIRNKEKIGLYGDYDADGTTSIALFYHFLRMFKVEAATYQPNRFVEGYGLHISSIDQALKDKVDLLITFDCGIMNHESARYAQESDLELIITDHHNDGLLEKPCALAVVNPNRSDQPKSELKKLAGVGVSFALAREIKLKVGDEIPSIYPLLQFAAIGTIGDMVQLNPMNLKIVRHGLKQFQSSEYPAIQELMTLTEFSVADSEFIGFKVAPLINAKGRLESPNEALDFLKSLNNETAKEKLKGLVATNESRKKIQNENAIIAKNKIKKHGMKDHEIIFLYHEKFHQGVIGLIASGVVRECRRPTIVATKDVGKEGIIKASVRSYGDFDIFNFLKSLDFPFVSFGGHIKAAGFSIKESDLPLLQNKISEMGQYIKYQPNELPVIKIESFELDMSLALAQSLFEPFGEGNPRPVYEVIGTVERIQKVKEKHLKLWLMGSRTPIMIFNYFDRITSPTVNDSHIPGQTIKIKTSCKIGIWEGNYKLELTSDSFDLITDCSFKTAVNE